MKKFNTKVLVSLAIFFVFGLFGSIALFALGPAAVDLGTSGNFAILSKTGITNVPTSVITGDVGSSPITGASIALTCAEVTGTVYTTDAAGPLPCRVIGPSLLTTAVNDMEAAYTDAATRTPGAGPNLNIGGGTVVAQTLTAGTYTWTTPVTITGDLTLSGGATDTWIFQVNGTLDLNANMSILLTGGAVPENIFWQTTSTVNLMANSHLEGNILSQTDIAMRSGASINGRALAQTAVTLIANTITIPTGFTPVPVQATLTVIKTVINDSGRTKSSGDFVMNVTGTNVSSSSFAGSSTGTTITLDAGAYTVDENIDADYTKTLSADCSGTILAGEDRTCTITNDDIAPVSSGGGGGGSSGGSIHYGCRDPLASNYEYFSSSRPSLCVYAENSTTGSTTSTPTSTPQITTPPKLPKTGFSSSIKSPWYQLLYSKILNIIS